MSNGVNIEAVIGGDGLNVSSINIIICTITIMAMKNGENNGSIENEEIYSAKSMQSISGKISSAARNGWRQPEV